MTTEARQVSNPGSALGEAVGKLFEMGVIECLTTEVERRGYTIQPDRLVNGTGNTYQIDAVVFDQDKKPCHNHRNLSTSATPSTIEIKVVGFAPLTTI